MARKRVGELLVERGAITPGQLKAGLEAQARTRQRLGLTLIQQGVLDEDALAQALSESLGIPRVDLVKTPVDWSAVHMLRARFCEAHELFPFALSKTGASKTLLVAMSDPQNEAALEEIQFTTGLLVLPRIATHTQVREAILRCYHRVGAQPPGESDDVIEGEEVISGPQTLPPETKGREQLIQGAVEKTGLGASVAKDLDFLFGDKAQPGESFEKQERMFWALMRLLTKKGVITRDEFFQELGQDD
jgi:hypothetical protein